ncbi:methyltransferase domain-containing protein [Enterococcus faecalis]|uniref:methyltransferase domain-containing protein n=1 Tax=Enterococcus faecalis TaxID=1351 RepID=UPI002FBDFCC9
MKQFIDEKYVSNYLEDIRTKIPGYNLMFELVFDSVLPTVIHGSVPQNILLVGGGIVEIDYLKSQYSSVPLTIIEASREMLKAYQNSLGNSKAELINARFEEYELAQRYSFGFSFLVFHFVSNKRLFLKKMYDSLVSNGFFIVSVFSDYHLDWWKEFSLSKGADSNQIDLAIKNENNYMYRLESEEVRNMILEAGFKKVEMISQILCVDLLIATK